MIDPKFFDDLAKKFTDAMPDSVKEMRADFEKNMQAVMRAGFSKLDLVTREEFDIQKEVLAHTRAQVEALEKKLTKIEEQMLTKKTSEKKKA